MTTPELAYSEIEKLVKSFKSLSSGRRNSLNEMQTRLGYILPLFHALGWDTSNIDEVTPEEKVSRGWVDFSFRIGGIPRYFLETKRVNEDLNDPRWVKQTIDYAWTKSVTWALLSDFEGLRVFNAEWKEINPFSARFFDLDLDTYLSKFDQLWWLSKPEIMARRLDLEAEKVGKKNKRLPVSQVLFEDLKQWREDLYKAYKGFNPIYSPAQVDEAVLRLLNRLIFIRTAEDREVEPVQLQPLVRELRHTKQFSALDRHLSGLFRKMDATYNSELFAPHFSEELLIAPTSLEEVIEGLYEKDFVQYNFNALDADVLGTVYEQYLGHVVAEAEGETHVQEKRKKRKSQGIYYTPSFVTKYIVQQTVGRYLEESGYDATRPPRVLDIACGSGSFLIDAFDTIDAHVAKMRGQAHGDAPDAADRARQLEVLQNCIFGVDRDKQAVEVARLNLLLRALHSPYKLPMLENIAIADSLQEATFDDNFAQVMKEGGFDIIVGNPPYVRIQTLDKVEVDYFNQNFVSATGNYDIYVLFVERALQLLKPGGFLGYILPNKFMQSDYGIGLRKLLSDHKMVWEIIDFGDAQVFEGPTTYTCLLFLQKSAQAELQYALADEWLREQGARPDLSTIDENRYPVPSERLTQAAWTFRETVEEGISEKCQENSVPLSEFAAKIYQGMITSADKIFLFEYEDDFNQAGSVLRLHSEALDRSVEIEKGMLRPVVRSGNIGRYWAKPTCLLLFPYEVSQSKAKLLGTPRIRDEFPKAWKYLGQVQEPLEQRESGKFAGEGWYRFGRTQNIAMWDQPKLLIPYMVQRLSAYSDEANLCFVNVTTGGYGLVLKDHRYSELYLMGLLNSHLLDFLFRPQATKFHGGYFGANKQYIETLPVHSIDFTKPAEKAAHDDIVRLAEEMLALQKERQAVRPEDDLDHARSLDRQIVKVDEAIDERVYELYGLTKEEIGIVADL